MKVVNNLTLSEKLSLFKFLEIPIIDFSKEIINFEINVDNLPKFQSFIQGIITSVESEKYYVKALRNLLKKINIYELYQQLNNETITEEEFNDEISKNKDKYIINLNNNIDKKDIFIINKIMEKIGIGLSCDAISEMFSIDPVAFDSILEKG